VLDQAPQSSGWEIAAAVSTRFIEGTQHERGEVDPTAPRRPAPPLEQHPLVVHYGLPLEHLALTKAHRQVEGEHRAAAWRILVKHVAEPARPRVVEAMQSALEAWLSYRDDVAAACGLTRPRTRSSPPRASGVWSNGSLRPGK
jgi:pyrroloquinoline-quinone synthase